MSRLATAAELDAVHAIAMQPSVLQFLDLRAESREHFAPRFAAFLAAGTFFVHERDGAVVGFVRAARGELQTRHVAYVSLLAVDPALAGSGIARRMLDEAIATLRADGVRRIELGVESTDPRALAFYATFGFEVEGVLRDGYFSEHEGRYIDDLILGRLLD